MINKICVFFSVLLMLFITSAYAVNASETMPVGGISALEIGEVIFDDSKYMISTLAAEQMSEEEEIKKLKEVLEEGLLAHSKYIYISSFNYNYTDENKDKVFRTFYEVIHKNHNIVAHTGLYWGIDSTKTKLIAVVPMYLTDSLVEDVAIREKMDAEIAKYVRLADAVPDMLGKLLVIHDEFIRNNTYATEELEVYNEKLKGSQNFTRDDLIIFSPAGVFLNNRAVCQGNSIALSAIYKQLGITSGFCMNNSHIWNVLKLDGKWYHFDETWDDIDDSENLPVHRYFMVSNDVMTDHTPSVWRWIYPDNVTAMPTTDKKYESGYIFSGNLKQCFSYEDGEYKVEIGYKQPFYSADLRLKGLILTKPYDNDGEKQKLTAFSYEKIDEGADIFCAGYNGKTVEYAKKNNMPLLKKNTVYELNFPSAWDENYKIFFWKTGTLTPVSEVRNFGE